MQTLYAFNLLEEQENINPKAYLGTNYQVPSQMGLGGSNQYSPSEQHMLVAKELHPDNMLVQLMQQMQNMQAQLATLSSNNKDPKSNGFFLQKQRIPVR